ncbi:uncharacterized protein LOC116286384 [Actinia tenebrosa]|uniref:Phospholipid scramblase n=1 Tax=Actinia tenebrosa TaxID=6105 RepID=A0A6P8GWX7_ACTTE|nr:uncharacterized protein LOC116286384 [Actinia tenebrosa]XP_031548755.1 uncharacterized protein LOC116286384 [Actinia tenebrosa]
MAKVHYETKQSFAYRQDLSGSVEFLENIHGSNEALQKNEGESVQLIQPGQKVVTRERKSTYIPMGLEILQDVEEFVIKQNYESEAWWNTSNFSVENGRGIEILEVRQEKAENGCIQALLGNKRQYYMKVYVNENNWIMEIDHPWSFSSPIFCPWKSPSMIVRMPTGEVLGQVRNASRETCGSCLPPTQYFEVFNFEGRKTHTVTGPTCCPCECSRNDPASFELLQVDKEDKPASHIGRINHEWRGFLGGVSSCCVTEESERVSITFPRESSVQDKALFLSLGFLAFFTYFEVQ